MTHSPLPWTVHANFPDHIVPADHARRSVGGSMYEADDRDRYALVIALAKHDDYSGFAHEISKKQAEANAALIVTAVNAHEKMRKALEEIARQKLTSEIDQEDLEFADLEGAFNAIIEIARAVKAAGKEE